MQQAATALGILHEYDLECMVLRALLQQRRWRRGKRGWAKLSLGVTETSLIVTEPGMSDLLSY